MAWSIGSDTAQAGPRLRWGLPGHTGEYCLNLPGYGLAEGEFIPQYLARELADALPDFHVDNRGTRIEIFAREEYGLADHAVVRAAVEAVLGEPVIFVDAKE